MSNSSETILISLSEPVKLNDKFGSYISYRVSTSTNKSIFSSKDFYVTRRFSDFVWLSKELSRLFPGIIVPSLPEKQAVGRFSADFVESRQRALERFLSRVASNSELGNCKTFVTFLEADDAMLALAMSETKEQKPKLSTAALKMFDRTMHTIQNSGKAEIEKSAADHQVEDLITYTNSLEKQLQNITKHADNWVSKCSEHSLTMSELGQSMTWLGQGETNLLGDSITQLGKMTQKVAEEGAIHAEHQSLQTAEPLQEYLRAIASVRIAIQQRQEKKQAYIDALTEVEVRQTAFNKLLGAVGKEDQATQKQQLVIKAQGAADAAKLEYEKVTERLLREAENFKFQKAQDIRHILLKFVELQIEYQRKAVETWASMLPSLQTTNLNSNTRTNIGFVNQTSNHLYEDDMSFQPVTAPPRPPSSSSNPFGAPVQEYTSFVPEEEDDMVGV